MNDYDNGEALCLMRRWQDVLRLRDWDIELRIVETQWRKSADVKIDREDKKAIVLINSHPVSDSLEELVVHELMHIKLHDMDVMIEDLLDSLYGTEPANPKREFAFSCFMTVLESTVEDLTKACLSAAGRGDSLSFGKLQPEIDKELGQEE